MTLQGITVDGPIAGPIDAMRRLVALSPTFQAWTGSADADAAEPKVGLVSIASGDRGPLAMLDLVPRFTRDRTRIQPSIPFEQSLGELLLVFRGPADPSEDRDTEFMAFVSKVGRIMLEIEERSGQDTLIIGSWTLGEVWTPDAEEAGHAPNVYDALIVITYRQVTV